MINLIEALQDFLWERQQIDKARFYSIKYFLMDDDDEDDPSGVAIFYYDENKNYYGFYSELDIFQFGDFKDQELKDKELIEHDQKVINAYDYDNI